MSYVVYRVLFAWSIALLHIPVAALDSVTAASPLITGSPQLEIRQVNDPAFIGYTYGQDYKCTLR
jgi:hypothetical protein